MNPEITASPDRKASAALTFESLGLRPGLLSAITAQGYTMPTPIQTGAIPLIDLAYQGFGDGLEEDAAATRKIAAAVPELLIAASCSKNFGIYRERTGILIALTSPARKAVVQGNLSFLNRQNYSFPPDHGARLVTMILEDAALTADWKAELEEVRQNMLGLRRALADELRRATNTDRFDFVASHRGTAGGTVILVVGVIHGNENAGLAILDELRTRPLPPNIDLWLMDAMNPDGLANDVRGNGNQVDLNRNFPHDWTAVAQLGEWEYSGTGPASEPETQAFMAFADRVRPSLTLWYHQDLYRISPSTRSDGPLRERYAHITGLPLLTVSGGTYTGVAATWVRKTVPEAMSFIVELGPTLTSPEATLHAAAVLDIATMARAIG